MALMFFVICIVNFVDLLVVAARKEMCLTTEIKNRDLEFVKASHDIRASLAGITGMVEMSINDLPQGSELAKNLKKVKSRSEDLKSKLLLVSYLASNHTNVTSCLFLSVTMKLIYNFF